MYVDALLLVTLPFSFRDADFIVHTRSFLDQKDATNLEYKLDSFSSVYQKLTGKVRPFFPRPSLSYSVAALLTFFHVRLHRTSTSSSRSRRKTPHHTTPPLLLAALQFGKS